METICSIDKPADFNPKFKGSFCLIETSEGEILLLHRQDWKPEGSTWGIPGGKISKGETSEEAVRREVFEETGISLENINLLHRFYVKYPGYDFIFDMWMFKINEKCDVTINSQEHKDFCWIKPEDAIRELPLIGGLDKCFEKVY